MNLVAHQVLSFDHQPWQLGNYLGEMVRGKKYLDYPTEIQQGILLHREIDTFTDHHPIVRKSTARLHENHGKYAGVIVDIFYDYLLIKNWDKFCEEPFDEFTKKCYHLLAQHTDQYSPKLKNFTHYLIKDDWYHRYASLTGIDLTLRNMSVRTKFPNDMYKASKDLYFNQDLFEEEFLQFFPELVAHCKAFLHIVD